MKKSKSKLNIAMICDPIGSNKSGVVVSTLRFGKLLKERGHHVIFVGAKSKEHKDHSEHFEIKTYRYRGLPIPKSGGWYLAFPTVNELKKVFIEEKIDIVHIVLPMSGAIIAMRAARALNIKIVAHSHSQPENLFTNMPKFLQPTLFRLWNKYLMWVYSQALIIIYPSKLAEEILHWLNKKGQPSRVISNGINLAEYHPMHVGEFYKKFNIDREKTNLLYLGRLYPEKSLDTLIKAMPHIIREAPNTHLMLVGAGHMRDRLELLTKKLKMEKNVKFLGLVSEEDKVHAYNACDIFILPSLAELEGMVVLETMACGKPIIIADAPMSASRFLVEDNGFLFKHLNPESLAEKTLKLIKDKNLCEKMGRVSLEKVRKYDIHHSALLLENVYYEALEK
mgnify:CR=1 FL=1